MSVVYKCDWCDEEMSNPKGIYSKLIYLKNKYGKKVVAVLTMNSLMEEDICAKCFDKIRADALNKLRDRK